MNYGMLCFTIPIGCIFVGLGCLIYKGKMVQTSLEELCSNKPQQGDKMKGSKRDKIIGLCFVFGGIVTALLPLIISSES